MRRKRNVVQARSFAELLEQALLGYQNRAVETAQVIEELIALAREMRAADARGEEQEADRARERAGRLLLESALHVLESLSRLVLPLFREDLVEEALRQQGDRAPLRASSLESARSVVGV